MTIADASQQPNLVPGIRASLNAKLERLLAQPIIARLVSASDDGGSDVDDLPSAFRALESAAGDLRRSQSDTWREDLEDGTCTVRISIDYEDTWRGREKEVRETVSNTVESAVTFLTEEQKILLERSPREFLALSPPPETAELISFETDSPGGSGRVLELRLAAAPESRAHVRHLAIIPNLVQIERQLDALHRVESATDDGPLGPLRALVGASDGSHFQVETVLGPNDSAPDERLDEHQNECVRKAMATPHFAVIEGPPGSGKTTVITAIIRRALARGERVLVVSPTHVAVDNVVDKLVPRSDGATDRLDARSLPVRYAARPKKLSERALNYWVGAKKERRGAAIARRVQTRLTEVIPFADALFKIVDENAAGRAPLSSALTRVESVICGTPIGILSFAAVKNAPSASFGLLIVDEVSKMTLPEFLAIAVKARRWVVVGDPAQLPPFNNSQENGAALDDVVPPLLELACSVGAIFERAKPAARRDEKVVVVSSDPARAAGAIRAHLAAVMPDGLASVGVVDRDESVGVVVCSAADAERACDSLARSGGSSNGGTSAQVRILIERGLAITRPAFANVGRLVEPRNRALAAIFEKSFNVYHAQPWSVRCGQRLRFQGSRNGLEKCLPSVAALEALSDGQAINVSAEEGRRAMIEPIAARFAINTVSVYDWLTGIPTSHFDTSPLRELGKLSPNTLCDAVRPFVGTLKKQYRMHTTLSRVPRELFYFEEALLDGRADERSGCRARLVHVEADGQERESNPREVETIVGLIERLNVDEATRARRPEIMVITPYREQEARLVEAVKHLRGRGGVGNIDVGVCTLDRCQGREAEYVLLSLVRSCANAFFDMPKRWNVALTRAKEGLFIVGNIEAYLREAAAARRELNGQSRGRNGGVRAGERRPLMSLLARIIEAYDHQIGSARQRRASGVEQ